jgi:hypothetical protein
VIVASQFKNSLLIAIDRYIFSKIVPRIRFLNLMVVLAVPRACCVMEKEIPLYGSLSISIVIPFIMLVVSTATSRDDIGRAKEGRDCATKADEMPTSSSCNRHTIENRDMIMIVLCKVRGFTTLAYTEHYAHTFCNP